MGRADLGPLKQDGRLCLDKEGPEDGLDVLVVLGAALDIAVLPVEVDGGLGLLPGDVPLQVGLVAHNDQRQGVAPLLLHQVPQPGHLVKCVQVGHAVDQQHSVGRGQGAGEHGRELVRVAAARVLDVQAQRDAANLEGWDICLLVLM